MKKMIILLMIFVTIPAIAQIRLGMPLDSIRKEFPADRYSAQSGTLKSGDLYYGITTSLAKVVYNFDIYNYCNVVLVMPLTDSIFSWYKKKYDRDFKVVSATKWRAIDNDLIADVFLMYPDSVDDTSARPYFIWFFAEESSIDHSQTAEEYFNSGSVKRDRQDYAGAIADFTKAIEINPEYTDAYYNRGLAKAFIQDNEGAITDLTKTIENNPDNAVAYENRGISRNILKDFSGAIADFNKAIKLNPEYSLAYFSRGNAKFGLEQNADGCSDFRKAAALGYAEASEAIKYLCH